MTLFNMFSGWRAPAARHAADIAVGEMTDAQLRRAGLSKAEILHRTFSSFSTFG